MAFFIEGRAFAPAFQAQTVVDVMDARGLSPVAAVKFSLNVPGPAPFFRRGTFVPLEECNRCVAQLDLA